MRSAEDRLEALIDLDAQASRERPLYLFLDELPWIARSSPRFFRGLSTLWNNALSKNPCVKVFVAGSATRWMIDHVIHSRTGLAKRVTGKIHMQSLDLVQTKQFLIAKGMRPSHDELLQIYSALGGIPYYLDVLQPALSPTENLHKLLVENEGQPDAGTEYDGIFRCLSSHSIAYRKVIDVLVEEEHGLTHSGLSLALTGKEKPDGNLLDILENLERNELICLTQPWYRSPAGLRINHLLARHALRSGRAAVALRGRRSSTAAAVPAAEVAGQGATQGEGAIDGALG